MWQLILAYVLSIPWKLNAETWSDIAGSFLLEKKYKNKKLKKKAFQS